MISALLDKNFFIGVFSILIIVLLIWLCVKFPSARLACFMLFTLIFAGLTSYCVINLNIYYNAEGGIYGEITGLFSPSVSVEETSIQFNNLELIQYLDTDTYYCKIITDKVISVDSNKNYEMYVNDTPCSNSKVTKEYITCDYRYQFFDEKDNLLCDDVLQIRLVFNKNNSYFYVFTENGTTSVKYWNYYINKNDFVLSIKEVNFENKEEISYGNGEFEELYRVDYVYTDDYTETKYYTANSHLELTNLVGIESWTIGEDVVSNDFVITEDLVVNANFATFNEHLIECLVCPLSKGYIIGSLVSKTGLIYFDIETEKYSVISFYGYGWNGYGTISRSTAMLHSLYNDVKNVIFMENTKSIVIMENSFDYSYAFSNDLMLKIVYSNKDEEGLYLYDVLNDTTTKIYDTGYWASFTGKFNEFTGFKSTVKISGNYDYYLRYDFITENLTENPVVEGEVGF